MTDAAETMQDRMRRIIREHGRDRSARAYAEMAHRFRAQTPPVERRDVFLALAAQYAEREARAVDAAGAAPAPETPSASRGPARASAQPAPPVSVPAARGATPAPPRPEPGTPEGAEDEFTPPLDERCGHTDLPVVMCGHCNLPAPEPETIGSQLASLLDKPGVRPKDAAAAVLERLGAQDGPLAELALRELEGRAKGIERSRARPAKAAALASLKGRTGGNRPWERYRTLVLLDSDGTRYALGAAPRAVLERLTAYYDTQLAGIGLHRDLVAYAAKLVADYGVDCMDEIPDDAQDEFAPRIEALAAAGCAEHEGDSQDSGDSGDASAGMGD